MSVKLESAERLSALKQGIEAKTGETYTDMTGAVNALIAGYGQGGNQTIADGILDGTLIEYKNTEMTYLRTNAFINHPSITRIIMPKLNNINAGAFRECPKLELVDAYANSIQANSMRSSSSLRTVILRISDRVSTLLHINGFQGTPFASDGTGGTIYVPEALIESYKTATNWVTLYEAGTCNFVAIEGSKYE